VLVNQHDRKPDKDGARGPRDSGLHGWSVKPTAGQMCCQRQRRQPQNVDNQKCCRQGYQLRRDVRSVRIDKMGKERQKQKNDLGIEDIAEDRFTQCLGAATSGATTERARRQRAVPAIPNMPSKPRQQS
jgi:hypothetical protein